MLFKACESHHKTHSSPFVTATSCVLAPAAAPLNQKSGKVSGVGQHMTTNAKTCRSYMSETFQPGGKMLFCKLHRGSRPAFSFPVATPAASLPLNPCG